MARRPPNLTAAQRGSDRRIGRIQLLTRRALLISAAPLRTGELMAWAYVRQGGGPYASWHTVTCGGLFGAGPSGSEAMLVMGRSGGCEENPNRWRVKTSRYLIRHLRSQKCPVSLGSRWPKSNGFFHTVASGAAPAGRAEQLFLGIGLLPGLSRCLGIGGGCALWRTWCALWRIQVTSTSFGRQAPRCGVAGRPGRARHRRAQLGCAGDVARAARRT